MKSFVVFSSALVFLWLLCVQSSLGKPLPIEDEEDYYPYPEYVENSSEEFIDNSELYVPDDDDDAEDLNAIEIRKKRAAAFTSDENLENAGDLLNAGEGERPVDEQEVSDSDIAEAEAVNIDEEVAEGEKNEEEPEDGYAEAVEETPQDGEQSEIVVPDEDDNGNGGSEEEYEDLGFGYPEEDYDFKL